MAHSISNGRARPHLNGNSPVPGLFGLETSSKQVFTQAGDSRIFLWRNPTAPDKGHIDGDAGDPPRQWPLPAQSCRVRTHRPTPTPTRTPSTPRMGPSVRSE